MTVTEIPRYSLAERDRRWSLAGTMMDEHNLDAIVVFGEHEDAGPAPHYFDTWFTNDRPGAVVVYPRAAQPISLVALSTVINDHMESMRRGDDVWIAPPNFRADRSAAGIAGAINEHGLARGTIGVVGLEPYPPFHAVSAMPYRLWSDVLAQLPAATFVHCDPHLTRLMMVLGEEEIAVVRHAAGIGDAMAHAMVSAARPGAPESDVYTAGMAAAHQRGTVVPGMHLWSGREPVGWGPPQWAYRPSAPRILECGDVISSEVFCGFGMRATQHQVTIAIGDVHEDFERAAQVARASYAAGLETLRCGRTFGEVADAMVLPVLEAGGWMRGPQIHALNPFGAMCGVPPDSDFSRLEGARRYPHQRGFPTQGADIVLEPGMTFAFEPSCAFERHPVTVGGTVIVGKDAPIELNSHTAQLLRAAVPQSGSGRR